MWLMVAIICLLLAIYKSLFIGYGDGLYFLMFTLLATVLWQLRRRMRIRMQKEEGEQG